MSEHAPVDATVLDRWDGTLQSFGDLGQYCRAWLREFRQSGDREHLIGLGDELRRVEWQLNPRHIPSATELRNEVERSGGRRDFTRRRRSAWDDPALD
ncbi:MAG: hypothetical protein JSS20_10795 [Proteobacteria bacterium]|nr:hypothetical protein [Pseudomonadota bacterium]